VKIILLLSALWSSQVHSKEVALSFDDAPVGNSNHSKTHERTDSLIKSLKELDVKGAMIFANPCKRNDSDSVINQLKKYIEAGHFIGNHTCSHPRLDEVGFNEFSKDAQKADSLMFSLMGTQKFFRYPYLNEGKEEKTRNQMREWLQANKYRNGYVSIDNDDYIFSFVINQAKEKGKKIDYQKIEDLFIKHITGAAAYYDDLAIKTIGRSPKHVILLHEMDATVMFIKPLVKELRRQGWTIISAEEAYKDKMYLEAPKNTYANNGIIAQLSAEKTGENIGYKVFDEIKAELKKITGL
jgi:peptidoglycan/xylan/chitin deacetylase (PgdA/CDA1 family)